MSLSGPCHGCQDRKPGCHGQCPLYKAYQARIMLERNQRYQQSLGIPDRQMCQQIEKRKLKDSKRGRKP